MKKNNRILKNRDFSLIIRKGKKFHTSNLSFYYIPNQNKSFRIGITVSKKVSKLAVIRNKIKRQISAILNEEYNPETYLDIVVIVKSNVSNLNFNEFKTNIKKFINHVK